MASSRLAPFLGIAAALLVARGAQAEPAPDAAGSGAAPAATSSPPAPPAQPPPSDIASARAHYKRGVQLYEQGSYEPALSELQRAEQLAPTYKLAYNIALVQVRLGNAASALRAFRTYLEVGGAEVPPARRSEVEVYLVDLARRVATVDVTVNVVGAEVTLDERPIGTAPLAASLELNPGPHRIAATKAGYTPMSRELDAISGEHVSLPLTLGTLAPPAPTAAVAVPASAPGPAPAPVPVPPSLLAPIPAPPHGPRAWIGWTVTGVLAAGAVATGVAALVESHVVSEDVNDHATAEPSIRAAHQSAVALALTSDILTASALVSGIVTGYIVVASKHSAAANDREPVMRARLELRLGVGTAGIDGTF